MKLFTKDIDKKLFAQYSKGAELEGQKLLPYFSKLLIGWLHQNHQCVDMRSLHQSWIATGQTRHLITLPLAFDSIPNRSGELVIMNP